MPIAIHPSAGEARLEVTQHLADGGSALRKSSLRRFSYRGTSRAKATLRYIEVCCSVEYLPIVIDISPCEAL